ncbi:glycoside hydrolase family 32 protein [Bifidobacterium subtile]|uniref:beta-fructofuranosidase n=1 Tax=Bifidobacterium subtile TaxID=77635 RepID=A0A087DU25_9BIFI|nr:GH32 C-terminal domain-containing protein [Bifidobacterium subtile]KFI99025.1 beta-(1-2)-fructofuranosidase [Bifidobacterium subtile]QOL36953.1 glycoside hydrolase family 32 protein [Bifidobacterium subtile]
MGLVPTTTPILDHDAELTKAEAGVAQFAASRNDRWYPKFHIASDGGWINDPNGLCYYRGRWHVFYQLHPFGTQWGQCHWGHVSSADMVTWRREPIAMAPSLEEEKDGVYSGSAAIGDDGTLRFYYTGHRNLADAIDPKRSLEVQLLATAQDDDAIRLAKHGMVVDCPRDEVNSDFRDPKVWKTGGIWYMTFGVSSAHKRGQMWLYTSHDMVEWSFERVLFEHPDPDVFMLECPDFFPVTGPDGEEKWVIGFSAMGSKPHGFMNRNASNAGYMIGSWTPGEAFRPESEFRLWDCGHNFYAPQSFTAPDGRQIMYGWMSPFAGSAPMQEDGWCGQLTLPREITLGADGDLHTSPVKEVSALRAGSSDLGAIELQANEEHIIADDAEAVEIELTLNLARSTAERMGLKIHATSDGSYTYVAYDDQLGRVVIDRQAAARGDRGYRAAPLSDEELSKGVIDLRLFIDRGSIEVYVNDGRQVLSSYSYPSDGPRAIKLTSESGVAHTDALRIHRLKSIGLE